MRPNLQVEELVHLPRHPLSWCGGGEGLGGQEGSQGRWARTAKDRARGNARWWPRCCGWCASWGDGAGSGGEAGRRGRSTNTQDHFATVPTTATRVDRRGRDGSGQRGARCRVRRRVRGGGCCRGSACIARRGVKEAASGRRGGIDGEGGPPPVRAGGGGEGWHRRRWAEWGSYPLDRSVSRWGWRRAGGHPTVGAGSQAPCARWGRSSRPGPWSWSRRCRGGCGEWRSRRRAATGGSRPLCWQRWPGRSRECRGV